MTEHNPLMQLKVGNNILDRAIGYVAPRLAAQRMQARMQMAIAGQWTGAQRLRPSLKKWNPLIGDADADSLDDLKTLTARSRDASRNQPLALGVLRTNRTSVVGAGLLCRPSIDAAALGMNEEQATLWEQNTRSEFDMWASSKLADANGQMSWYGQQGLAFLSFLESGDCFALTPMDSISGWPYRLQIQLVEADRCSTPSGVSVSKLSDGSTIHGGIERDPQGRVVAAHFSKQHPGSMRGVGREWERVPFYGDQTNRLNVVHLHDPQRINQSRGVPYLAPVLEMLKQLTRYSDAELAAAVVSAMFTVFVKSETGMGFGGVGGPNPTAGSEAASGQEQYELGSGAVIELGANQDVSMANPMRPNQAFDPFVQACLRQIGVALEIPFELLVKHFSSSYTAARASMQEAWRYFMSRRRFFATSFCQPIYELFLDDAISLGRIQAPGWFDEDPRIRYAYSRAKWVGPPRGQINERLETESALKRVEGGISTLDEETAQATGGDWETNHRQRVIEQERRERDGLIPSASSAPQTVRIEDDQS